MVWSVGAKILEHSSDSIARIEDVGTRLIRKVYTYLLIIILIPKDIFFKINIRLF